MKKTILMMAVLSVLAACGGGDKEKNTTSSETKTESPAGDLSSNPIYQKAVKIIANSDCTTCHHIEDKLVGPAWRDVAKKYAGQDTAVQYLAAKIKAGGSGVWGQVPMAPHATMSDEDAKTLAEYVMLLNEK